MRREACCCAPLGGQTEHQSDSAQVALSKSRSKSPRQFDLASCPHRRDLCRLTLVRRQKAADGDANQKHRGKHHSNCTFVSWRRKPSHLLVQKFLIASVHWMSPFLFQLNATMSNKKRSKTVAVSLTVAEQTLGCLICGAKS